MINVATTWLVVIAFVEPSPAIHLATESSVDGLVCQRLECRPFAAETLAATDESSVVWLWREDVPPLRLQPDQFSDWQAIWQEWAAQDFSKLRLNVNILGDQDRRKAVMEDLVGIRYGPPAMWSQVPESLLPIAAIESGSVWVPSAERSVRVRAIGEAYGSWWVEVSESANHVLVEDAEEVVVRFVNEANEPQEGVNATLGSYSSREFQAHAQEIAEAAALRLPSVPSTRELSLLLTEEDCAPVRVSAFPDRLPSVVRMEKGAEIAFAIVDEKARPIPEVEVSGETWSDQSTVVARSSLTNEQGAAALGQLPNKGAIRVSVQKAGFIPLRATFLLHEQNGDVIQLVLRRGQPTTLYVRDFDTSSPIAGAAIRSAGTTAFTDSEGAATILLGSQTTALTVSAPGYIAVTTEDRLTDGSELFLERSAAVIGQILAEDEESIEVRIDKPSGFRAEIVSPDFEFEIEPNLPVTLTFFNSQLGEYSTRVEAERGEQVDLGVITLNSDYRASGIVTDASGTPIADVKVWALREAPEGATASWLTGNTTDTTTDDEGAFRLTGLSAGAVTLRFDAFGYPRKRKTIQLQKDEMADGSVTLELGASLSVDVGSDRPHSVEFKPFEGDEYIDTKTVVAVDGIATFRNLSIGTGVVIVRDGLAAKCRKEVEITSADTSIQCLARHLTVHGTVTIDGQLAGGGTLRFSPKPQGGTLAPGVIMARESPLGAVHQDVYGAPEYVYARVTSSGTYRTESLTAGRWFVAWSSGPATTAAVEIGISDLTDSAYVDLEFHGSALHGVVLNDHDQGVGGAAVISGNKVLGISDGSGAFSIAGLAPGIYHVRAARGEQVGPPVAVTLASDPEDIVLRIGDEDSDQLRVSVRDEAGRPSPNAIVVLQDEMTTRMATTDSEGRALFSKRPSSRVRAAALYDSRWTFGGWTTLSGISNIELGVGNTGAVRVTAERAIGLLDIVSETGWSLGELYLRIGRGRLHIQQNEFIVTGLPPGPYSIVSNGKQKWVNLKAGTTKDLHLEGQ